MDATTSETPVLDLLAEMTAASVEASSLDAETLILVRIAALAAVDASTVSYLLNIEAGDQVGIDAEQVRGVLAAIAPIVGTARIVTASARLVEALGIALEVAYAEAEAEAEALEAGRD